MVLPRFTSDGLLPPGDRPLTIDELRQSYLIRGEGLGIAEWDADWRARLANTLDLFTGQLWQVGVERIFVDGSFVTAKPRPGDVDVYFECELARLPWIIIGLSQQEPRLPWEWTQRPIESEFGIPKLRIGMSTASRSFHISRHHSARARETWVTCHDQNRARIRRDAPSSC